LERIQVVERASEEPVKLTEDGGWRPLSFDI
jgi:hypothetical protein